MSNDDMGETISFLPGPRAKESKPKTVNIFLGFFFMVNFVLGTGFLGVPYSFYRSGVIAGALTLVCISVITWMSALWEVETMARAQVCYWAILSYIIYTLWWTTLMDGIL